MIEFKKILFPVDFSENSEKIVPYVHAMADKLNSGIIVVHVVGELRDFPEFDLPHISITDFEAEIAKAAELRMSEFIDNLFKEVQNLESRVLIGDVSEVINDLVKNEGIDLIVMGTHGRKGLDRIIFGSVAERVVKTASCPVMTVNPYRVK